MVKVPVNQDPRVAKFTVGSLLLRALPPLHGIAGMQHVAQCSGLTRKAALWAIPQGGQADRDRLVTRPSYARVRGPQIFFPATDESLSAMSGFQDFVATKNGRDGLMLTGAQLLEAGRTLDFVSEIF